MRCMSFEEVTSYHKNPSKKRHIQVTSSPKRNGWNWKPRKNWCSLLSLKENHFNLNQTFSWLWRVQKAVSFSGGVLFTPWKSKTIKIIVPSLGWLKFPTKTIVFGDLMIFGLLGYMELHGYSPSFCWEGSLHPDLVHGNATPLQGHRSQWKSDWTESMGAALVWCVTHT